MISVTQKVHIAMKARRRVLLDTPPVADDAPVGRIPRISKLMALAIRFDRLIREGIVRDMTELAELARVTQPRMTQIMNLLHLAPDIQEELLFLPAVADGRDGVTERDMRLVCAEVDWGRQRRLWVSMKSSGRLG